MTIEILSGDLFEDHRGKIFSYFPENKIVEYNLMVTNAGDERGYHYHPHFDEYIMIVHGSVDFTAYSESENFTKVFKVGDSFRIPKNVPHTFKALEDLKSKCLSEPIIFELLPDRFTINEIQDVYQSILSVKLDNRNFRRKLISKKYIIALDEKQVGVSKRPSQLYMFSKDIYEKLAQNNYLINI